MQAIVSGSGGLAAVSGAMIVGGAVAALVGIFIKPIRRLFPPVITGTVVFTIGLSLYPTAINYMAGGTGNTYESVVVQPGPAGSAGVRILAELGYCGHLHWRWCWC